MCGILKPKALTAGTNNSLFFLLPWKWYSWGNMFHSTIISPLATPNVWKAENCLIRPTKGERKVLPLTKSDCNKSAFFWMKISLLQLFCLLTPQAKLSSMTDQMGPSPAYSWSMRSPQALHTSVGNPNTTRCCIRFCQEHQTGLTFLEGVLYIK